MCITEKSEFDDGFVTDPQNTDLSKYATEYVILTVMPKSVATIKEIANALQDVTSLPLEIVPVTYSA